MRGKIMIIEELKRAERWSHLEGDTLHTTARREGITYEQALEHMYEYERVTYELLLDEIAKREQQPCHMCSMENPPSESGTHSYYIHEGHLWHYDTNCGWEGEAVKFCPNCGREVELGEETQND